MIRIPVSKYYYLVSVLSSNWWGNSTVNGGGIHERQRVLVLYINVQDLDDAASTRLKIPRLLKPRKLNYLPSQDEAI